MNIKGSLPLLILFILSQQECHGYQIAKAIKQQSAGTLDFKEGSLYPTLHGLEQQGLISASEQVENGRPRRYYTLTEAGRSALREQREHWERYTWAVNQVLKGGQA